MNRKRAFAVAGAWMGATIPLWGGTGRPSDGFLSFVLLLGFLGLLWGILELVAYVKRKISELLNGLY